MCLRIRRLSRKASDRMIRLRRAKTPFEWRLCLEEFILRVADAYQTPQAGEKVQKIRRNPGLV
jgi:hypothetical protein